MSFTIYAKIKKAGRQKRESLVPAPYELVKKPGTVRELLTALTELSVKEYNERKDAGDLLPCLTKEEISDQASEGKISFGIRGGADADPAKAAENAIQSFEDGIYRVFYGEGELTGLDEEIPWGEPGTDQEKAVFTFIRLTMLSGW